MRSRVILVAVVLCVFLASASYAAAGNEPEPVNQYSIGVFVPGVVEGSPTYELLVDGIERAATERSDEANGHIIAVKIVEGGFNQATWEQGLTSMAASGEYDLIVSSNPEMPDIVESITAAFPEARFLIMDAYHEGNAGVHTVMFNQREQAFLAGYFAGLVSTSSMSDNPDTARIGLLAGQEYPIMNGVILPAYEFGAKSVDPDAEVDFRVLGNWYDAGRAAELAESMYASGADVILPIAGGGSQGVIAAARERKRYVVWYDTNGLNQAPGIVVGSTYIALDEAAYERTLEAIDGTLVYSEAEVLGVADGYVGFVQDDSLYVRNVEDSVRAAMAEMVDRMQAGEFYLEMPLN